MTDVITGYANTDGTGRGNWDERRTLPVYPTIYRVVHEMWNDPERSGIGIVPCDGDPDRYEPDEHDCYRLAAELRVRMHAAGLEVSQRMELAAPKALR